MPSVFTFSCYFILSFFVFPKQCLQWLHYQLRQVFIFVVFGLRRFFTFTVVFPCPCSIISFSFFLLLPKCRLYFCEFTVLFLFFSLFFQEKIVYLSPLYLSQLLVIVVFLLLMSFLFLKCCYWLI